jgi:hypothetical protein
VTTEAPEGSFVIEAISRVDPEADLGAIGAAVTVELCGHWEHEPPCRWPHHTAVEQLPPGRIRTRTVVVAGTDSAEAERRIRSALAAGSAPGVEARWSALEVRSVPLDRNEVELASRIAPSAADRQGRGG